MNNKTIDPQELLKIIYAFYKTEYPISSELNIHLVDILEGNDRCYCHLDENIFALFPPNEDLVEWARNLMRTPPQQ